MKQPVQCAVKTWYWRLQILPATDVRGKKQADI